MHFNFLSEVVLDEMQELVVLIEKSVFLNGLSAKKVTPLIIENTGLYN